MCLLQGGADPLLHLQGRCGTVWMAPAQPQVGCSDHCPWWESVTGLWFSLQQRTPQSQLQRGGGGRFWGDGLWLGWQREAGRGPAWKPQEPQFVLWAVTAPASQGLAASLLQAPTQGPKRLGALPPSHDSWDLDPGQGRGLSPPLCRVHTADTQGGRLRGWTVGHRGRGLSPLP